MPRRLIGLFWFALIGLSLGCGEIVGPECPDEPERLKLVGGQDLLRLDNPENPTASPFIEEETYIRILSSSEVEIIYEKDDEIIVQTYEVTDRSTETRRW